VASGHTYSPSFPVLEYNSVQQLFFGGNFWDGRATGYLLQSPDAEQAQHPPVDPDEMGYPDTACIAYKLSQAADRPLFSQSISSYEQSPSVSAFSSKFDAYLKATYFLTADEMAGDGLFRRKGNCNSCHLDGRSTTLMPGQTDNGTAADVAPVFTFFGCANEGLPLNPRFALFYETTPDRF
jgi:cytochrome c peroxidase